MVARIKVTSLGSFFSDRNVRKLVEKSEARKILFFTSPWLFNVMRVSVSKGPKGSRKGKRENGKWKA